jgi:hypothetical protein
MRNGDTAIRHPPNVAKSLIATRFTGTLAAAKGRQQRKALRLAAVLAAANLYSDIS